MFAEEVVGHEHLSVLHDAHPQELHLVDNLAMVFCCRRSFIASKRS